jgi:hypothetical protein
MPPDVGPAVPQGLVPVHCSGIVAGLVPPLILWLVSEPPVKLHHHAVVPVKTIPASPPAIRAGKRRLPDRLRQPVRPFHVTLVSVLQHRVISAGRGGDELMQVSAPAQLRPLAHGRAQPGLVGQLPRERAGHPPAHVVEVRSRLGQVKHGLLHPGPRWIAVPEHRLDRPPRPVNADPADRCDMTLTRNCHMDRSGRPIGELQKFRRRLMTEDCTRTGREHRRPELSVSGGYSREGRVDTRVDLPPPITSDPELDHVFGEPGPKGLGAGDDAVLVTGKVAERGWELTYHAAQCEGRHRHWLTCAKIVVDSGFVVD